MLAPGNCYICGSDKEVEGSFCFSCRERIAIKTENQPDRPIAELIHEIRQERHAQEAKR